MLSPSSLAKDLRLMCKLIDEDSLLEEGTAAYTVHDCLAYISRTFLPTVLAEKYLPYL